MAGHGLEVQSVKELDKGTERIERQVELGWATGT